jgi:hypothetical protein
MRSSLGLLILVIMLPNAQAQAIDPRTLDYLEAEISFQAFVSADRLLDELNLSIYALPEFEELSVPTDFEIFLDDYGNRMLVLSWKDFVSQAFEIRLRVSNKAQFVELVPPPYPYSPPPDTWEYLVSTNNSIVDEEAMELARKLVQGASNSFEAVAMLAYWVNSNLEYDLEYAEVIKNSSWVLSNRKGTCDEFSSLFMALARAAGIPARYVAGIVYAREGWGYHGWAEVYLDGWVPVDATWMEVGWLDATHLRLGSFMDAGEVVMETRYAATGPVKLRLSPPEIEVSLIRKEPLKPMLRVGSHAYPSRIGLGKHAVIGIEVDNPSSCVGVLAEVMSRLYEGKPVLELEDSISIAICANQSKSFYFPVKARKDLRPGYVYERLLDIYIPLARSIVPGLVIDPAHERESTIDVYVGKDVALLGEEVGFEVVADAPYRVYSTLPILDGKLSAAFPGNHSLIAITDAGDLDGAWLMVRPELPFRIEALIPGEAVCGQELNLSLTITNLEKPRVLTIKSVLGEELSPIPTKLVSMGVNETKTMTLSTELVSNCTGSDQLVVLQVDDQRFYGRIGARREKPVMDLFSWLSSLLLELVQRLRELLIWIGSSD